MTGSSQAAALVSGLAALLIQAEPEVSNDDIKCMLMSSAEPAISADGRLAYSPYLQGSGLVNVSRAITVGDRGCGNDDLALDDDIARVDRFEGPAIFAEDGSPPRLPGEDELISPKLPEKGRSDSRRWGADAHLQRLTDPSQPSPIDWLGRHQADQLRMKALAEE
jgi:subtilisin family serine protease